MLVRTQAGQVIGEVRNRTLYRRFRGSKHLLRKPPALCIEAEAYRKARPCFERLEWHDVESGRVYHCDASHFDRYCIAIQRGDYPVQLALPLRYWAIEKPAPQGQRTLQEV